MAYRELKEIDPGLGRFLDEVAARPIDILGLTPERARQASFHIYPEDHPSLEPIHRVIDVDIGEPLIRLFIPKAEGPLPVYLYFHAGGWVTGTLSQHEQTPRALANRIPCIVASVDYSLAPERAFPKPQEEGYRALRWAKAHIARYGGDPNRMIVGGNATGGTIGIGVAMMARDKGGPEVAGLLVVHPPLRFPLIDDPYSRCLDHHWLTYEKMQWCWSQHLAGKKRISDYAAPLSAGSLADLPPTIMVTAEVDPITEEDLDFIKRLQEAGVETTHLHYDKAIHGFLDLPYAPELAKRAFDEIAAEVRHRWG